MERIAAARTWFHVALGAIFFPCVGIPGTLTLALIHLGPRQPPEVQRWGRRLLALAVFDGAIIASLLLTLGGEMLAGRELSTVMPDGSRPVIGVEFEQTDGELRVHRVLPGGPADRAGIEAGDIVREVDAREVSSVAEVQQRIAAVGTTPVELQLERNGEVRLVEVQPVARDALARATGTERGDLFAAEPGGTCAPFDRIPWSVLGAAAVVGLLYLLGRRRGMDATLVWAGGLLVAVAVITEAVTVGVCALAGGTSTGVLLVGVGAQTVALLGLGWVLLRRAKPELRLTDDVPSRPWPIAVGLGAWYMMTGAFRLGAILLVLSTLVGLDPGQVADAPLQSVAASGELGPLGIALFVIPVVFLAPIGEELLFRGIVLPSLSRWMPTWAAIVTSGAMFGALHFQYGLFLLVIVFYGAVLGWARVASRSLRAPILLHMLINATATVVLLSR